MGLRAKLYSYLEHSGKSDQRIKGIPKRVRPQHEHYKSILMRPRPHTLQFSQIVSKHHHLTIKHTTKKALSGLNDKVYQISNLKSRPLGHYLNKERFAWIRKRVNRRLKYRLRRRSTTGERDSDSTTCSSEQGDQSPRSDSS